MYRVIYIKNPSQSEFYRRERPNGRGLGGKGEKPANNSSRAKKHRILFLSSIIYAIIFKYGLKIIIIHSTLLY